VWPGHAGLSRGLDKLDQRVVATAGVSRGLDELDQRVVATMSSVELVESRAELEEVTSRG
jgi:hypothetical protein